MEKNYIWQGEYGKRSHLKALFKELLKEQVYSSVLWEQSIRAMIADGVDIFVEIGPGKTLSGFMRKIDKSVKMFRIGTMEEVEKTVEAIKEL